MKHTFYFKKSFYVRSSREIACRTVRTALIHSEGIFSASWKKSQWNQWTHQRKKEYYHFSGYSSFKNPLNARKILDTQADWLWLSAGPRKLFNFFLNEKKAYFISWSSFSSRYCWSKWSSRISFSSRRKWRKIRKYISILFYDSGFWIFLISFIEFLINFRL